METECTMKLTVKDMHIDRSGVSTGHLAAVFTGVCDLAAVNYQHTHQHALCGLLAHRHSGCGVGLYHLSLSIPVDVGRCSIATSGVTDESDGTSQLHVICTGHLHHYTAIIVLGPLLSATDTLTHVTGIAPRADL